MSMDLETRIQIAVDNVAASESLGQFRQSMKNLKSLALEVGDTTSDEFKKVQKAIGDAQDRQADLNDAFKAMSGEPIERVAKSFKGLVSSLAVGDIQQAKLMFNGLKTSVVDLGAASTVALGGIGLLITAIGLLVKYWDDIIDQKGPLGDFFRGLQKSFQEIKQAAIDFTEKALLKLINAFITLKDVATNSYEYLKFGFKTVVDYFKTGAGIIISLWQTIGNVILDVLSFKNPKETIKKGIDDIQGKMKEFADNTIQNFENIKIKSSKHLTDLWSGSIKADEEANKKSADARKKAADEAAKAAAEEAKRLLEESKRIAKFKIDNAEYLRTEEEKRKKKAADDDLDMLEKLSQKELDEERKTQEESIRQTKEYTDEIIALQEAELKNKEEIEAAKRKSLEDSIKYTNDILKSGSGITNLGQTLLNNLSSTTPGIVSLIKNIGDASITTGEKIQQSLGTAINIAGSIGSVLAAGSRDQIANIQDETNEKLNSLEMQKNAGVLTEQQYQDAKNSIMVDAQKKELEVKKRAFNQDKAIRIAQAVMSTAQGVIAGLGAPFPMNLIMPAIAAAVGAAQIAIIAGQSFNGGAGAPSGGGISAPSGGAPSGGAQPQPSSFFGLGQKNLNEGGGKMGDQRVYVVESDISSTQGRMAKIRERATLGG